MLPGMGAQLQVTNSARLGDDDIIRELVLNWFLQIGYQFCCRNGWVILKDAGTTGQTTGQFRPEVGRRAAFMCPVVPVIALLVHRPGQLAVGEWSAPGQPTADCSINPSISSI